MDKRIGGQLKTALDQADIGAAASDPGPFPEHVPHRAMIVDIALGEGELAMNPDDLEVDFGEIDDSQLDETFFGELLGEVCVACRPGIVSRDTSIVEKLTDGNADFALEEHLAGSEQAVRGAVPVGIAHRGVDRKSGEQFGPGDSMIRNRTQGVILRRIQFGFMLEHESDCLVQRKVPFCLPTHCEKGYHNQSSRYWEYISYFSVFRESGFNYIE